MRGFMFDLCHKFSFPDLNVTLYRHYRDGFLDLLGNVEHWKSVIDQLFFQNPNKELWSGVQIHVWDIKHPKLKEYAEQKKAHLLDIDFDKAGDQSAVGLYFGADGKEIALGVWTDCSYVGYHPYEWSSLALSHELGHLVQDLCQLNEGRTETIYKLLSSQWETLRPKKTENVYEDFAECYRAILGDNRVRGSYSDGVSFPNAGKVITFVTLCYWLSTNLRNKEISQLTIQDSWIEWVEVSWFWIFSFKTRYAINRNVEMFKDQNMNFSWRKM